VNANASEVEKLSVQHTLAESWKEIDPKAQTLVFSTIEEAVDYVRDLSKQSSDGTPVKTLVTGSLHLVGGFLDVIETKPGEAVV
jgi:folylpolyglutamate synthase